jgi:hypothetical protein
MPTLLLVMLIANGGVRQELDVVMGFNGDDIREEIATGKRHVLGGEDDGFIYKLDARDRDIADLQLHKHQHHSPRKNAHTQTHKRRQNHLPNILPQIRLKLPLTIKQKIPRQPYPILPESFIRGVLAHSFEPVPDRLEEVVEVGFVFPVVESAAGVADLVAVGVAVWFEDVTCL